MSDPINDAIDAVQNTAPVAVAEPPTDTNGTAPPASKILTVEDILTAPDIQERLVEVPEWGGAVKIRSFTKHRQIELRQKALVGNEVDSERMELLMFVEGVVEPQFGPEHIDLLKGKSASAMDRVLGAILELGGMTPEAQNEMERDFRQGSGA
jgi:hypothetical protein